MIPDASEITRRRLTASMILRMMAVFAFLLACIPLIILATLLASDAYNYSGNDWIGFVVASVIPACMALVLWLLAPWVARLMIRVPRVAFCPNCKYKLEKLISPQCTECGYTLTPEFMTTPDERESGRYEPDTVLLRQISTLAVRLVSGGFLPISMIAGFAFAVDAIQYPEWSSWYPVYAWAWAALVTVAVLIFARRLSIVFVPGRSMFERNTEKTNT